MVHMWGEEGNSWFEPGRNPKFVIFVMESEWQLWGNFRVSWVSVGLGSILDRKMPKLRGLPCKCAIAFANWYFFHFQRKSKKKKKKQDQESGLGADNKAFSNILDLDQPKGRRIENGDSITRFWRQETQTNMILCQQGRTPPFISASCGSEILGSDGLQHAPQFFLGGGHLSPEVSRISHMQLVSRGKVTEAVFLREVLSSADRIYTSTQNFRMMLFGCVRTLLEKNPGGISNFRHIIPRASCVVLL